ATMELPRSKLTPRRRSASTSAASGGSPSVRTSRRAGRYSRPPFSATTASNIRSRSGQALRRSGSMRPVTSRSRRPDSLTRASAAAVVVPTWPGVPTVPSAPSLLGAQWTGTASWYGVPHHGRPTASGETFDKARLTAAHRTLPFGTRVAVTNLDNGRTVEVRVNDRGPFVAGRLLDLSESAARAIGGIGAGLIHVRIRVVALPEG